MPAFSLVKKRLLEQAGIGAGERFHQDGRLHALTDLI
jgi:hypothetical protein